MVAETMSATVFPAVLWAQRKNAVFVTFDVADLKNHEVCCIFLVFLQLISSGDDTSLSCCFSCMYQLLMHVLRFFRSR